MLDGVTQDPPWADERGQELPRVPPHSFQLEQALLGAILVSNPAYWRVAEFLRPEHFADPLHGRIFDAAARLIERNQVADFRTMTALFDGDETLAKNGRPTYIRDLAGAAISIIDAIDYGRQIHDLYLRRELIAVGEDIVNGAFATGGERPAATLIEQAEAVLYSIASTGRADDRLRDAAGTMTDTFDAISEAIRERALPDAERRARRIVSGLDCLDGVLTMRRGDFIVIAGASSMGKSALVDCVAEANERNGVAVALFSLEMPGVSWQQRRLTRHTGIAQRAMTRGDVTQHQFDRLMEARGTMTQRLHFIDDRPDLTPARLRSALRRLKRQHNIGLAVVDYIQLMQSDRPDRRDSNRTQDLGQITRALKLAASELDIAVVAASQISRGVNAHEDKRPDLNHLRESGSIEQDADTVVFVYREEYYLAKAKPTGKGGKPPTAQETTDYFDRLEKCRGMAELFVAKQRHGEARVTVKCRWDGARTQFSDIEEAAPDQNPQEELL